MPSASGSIGASPRGERALLIVALIAIALLAWTWLLRVDTGADMSGMSGMSGVAVDHAGMALPSIEPWSRADVALAFLMWAVMMIAMMVPSAAPMILAFAGLGRARRAAHTRSPIGASTFAFAAGYLVVWVGFGLGATLLQTAARAAGLLAPGIAHAAPALGGLLLIGIGAYQLTPAKASCLAKCRSPIAFLMTEWRDGVTGGLVMGVRHGVFCLGCCWALMLTLFAAGVMNLLWVALIAAYVLAEKALPGGHRLARGAGVLLIGSGAWLLLFASATR